MLALLADFISLVFPKNCAACGNPLFKQERAICLLCITKLPQTNYHNDPENPVAKIFWGRIQLEQATAFYQFTKKGKVQHLLHELKYKGNKECGIRAGELFGKVLKDSPFQHCSLIIPVPLHPKKQQKRGYNQSEQLAAGLSKSMGIPLNTTAFARAYHTGTQTKRSRIDRWLNVSERFVVKDGEALKGQHILLVDDVVTTGATLEACAAALRENSNVKISVAALAHA
jgi:ComF family protein